MKQTVFKLCAGMVLLGTVLAPVVGMAQTTTTTNASLGSIQTLMQQIQDLQSQIAKLKETQKTLKSDAAQQITSFVKNLDLGSQGDDVKALQALLASNANIYPEGSITGYFGPATARAIKRLQKENGLEQAGRVGPKTLALLNRLLGENQIAFESTGNATSTQNRDGDDDHKGKGEEKRPCAIVPPGHLIAPGWLRKNGGEKPIVPPCQKLPEGIEKKYKDGDWHPGTTTSDKLAPTLSAIVSVPSYNSATVTWTTNESATTKVYYGTTTPFTTTGVNTLSVSNMTLVTSHSASLTSLSPLTTYYFVVESKDLAGNTATSSVGSFTTTAIPDTTAPVISALTTTPAATTTVIAWTTNESATSKVYYSTVTPVVLGTASTVSDGTLVTSHSSSLSGLATSTQYYFVVESKDAANNTATSTQGTFTTLAL